MCDFIDGGIFEMFSQDIKIESGSENSNKICHKLLFSESIFNFKFHTKQSFAQSKVQAILPIRQPSLHLDIFLTLQFSETDFMISGKTVVGQQLRPIRSKEKRKIFVKELTKKSWLGMLEPYRLLVEMDSGEWLIKSPNYENKINGNQFNRKLHFLVDALVKRIIQVHLNIQKSSKFEKLQNPKGKKEKISQTLKYLFRCTASPSLSVRSESYEYQSLLKRYEATRCDLEDLQKYHRETFHVSQEMFGALALYGEDISKDNNMDYLNEISLRQKQAIHDQIRIPAFPVSCPKENKYIFSHCYFYTSKAYLQKKVAQGGNSQVFLLKPDLYEYKSTTYECDGIVQKHQSPSKYMSKYLVYKQNFNQNPYKEHEISRQTKIIMYMREGSCLFFPKYYLNIEKQTPYSKKLFMDYLPGDTLDTYLSLNQNTVSVLTKIYLIMQVIQALRFIRIFGVVHLDVKEQNIIIIKRMICKLIDFEESFHPKVCGQNHKPKYTKIYASPQVVTSTNGRSFTEKSDVFSFGIMAHNILFGKHPYYFPNQKKFEKCNFDKKLRDKTFYVPQQIEENGYKQLMGVLYQLVLKCIDMAEHKRPYLDWMILIMKSCFNIFTSQ